MSHFHARMLVRIVCERLPRKTWTKCGTWFYIISSCRGVHTVVLAFDSSRGGYVFTYASGTQVKIWRDTQERASESNKASWSQNKPNPLPWPWKLNERQGQLGDGTRRMQSLPVHIKLGQKVQPLLPWAVALSSSRLWLSWSHVITIVISSGVEYCITE